MGNFITALLVRDGEWLTEAGKEKKHSLGQPQPLAYSGFAKERI